MANIKLYGNTWDTSSVYDDAQGKTQKQINAKTATNDGYFEDMTVGTAEQLLSSKYTEDKVPYSFRQTGGGVDVGKRAEEMLVGGTVVWNQLCPELTSGNWGAENGVTASFSNGEVTISSTIVNNGIRCNAAYFRSLKHKYLISFDAKGTAGTIASIVSNNTNLGLNCELRTSNTFENAATIIDNTNKGDGVTRYLYIIGRDSVYENLVVKNAMIIDLTQMFGSTIADYIYGLEQATAGAGVAYFRSLFPKSYYAYNTGTLMSVNAAAHQTVGFNQWDEVAEGGAVDAQTGEPIMPTGSVLRIRSKNFIPCFPSTTYYTAFVGVYQTGSWYSLFFYDKDKKYLIGSAFSPNKNNTFVTPQNAYYMKFNTSDGWGSGTYNGGICINFSDPAKNGTYEPYEKHTYPLDSTLTLRGIPKLDSNNKLYYDGDIYASDGTVTRKYGIIDMGTMTWTRQAGNEGVYVFASGSITQRKAGVINLLTSKYTTTNITAWDSTRPNATISGSSSSINVIVRDDTYSDAASFKTAMSGIYLVYELDTPTTESASPYTNPQICDGSGTEEYVDAGVLAEERDVSVPVGHETKYGEDLVGKLEALPPIPDAPTTNGTYDLRVVVSGGEPTYSWVSV